MSEFKYTKDGRKVVVIGDLNSNESIVQEIIIKGDQEVPSGENTSMAKSGLFDEKVKTWKEQDSEERNRQYDISRNRLSQINEELREAQRGASKHISYLSSVVSKACADTFERLEAFLAGDTLYVVLDQYAPDLVEMSYSDMKVKDQNIDSGLKLLTLFGRDDGSLIWGINTWSDGSGTNAKCFVYLTRKDAMKKLVELLKAKTISEHTLEIAEKHGVKLDQRKLKKYYSDRVKGFEKEASGYAGRIVDIKKQITEINKGSKP